MSLKYCMNCKQQVTPERDFNWIAFVVLSLISLGLLGIIYLLYYAFKGSACPMCNSRNWGVPKK